MIWYEDILGFFDVDSLLEVIPHNEMDLPDRLNAIFRASLYIGLVAFGVTNDYRSFIIPIFIAGITFAIYKFQEDKTRAELDMRALESYDDAEDEASGTLKKHSSKRCTYPTPNNPFMNITMNEYTENPTRKKACRMNEKVGEYVNKYFNENLYRTTEDIYHKNASERQFYTMPSTQIPNDQDKFAKWLYGNPEKTCKEGNGLRCKYFS